MNVYKVTPGNWLTPGNDSSGKLASPDYYVFFWSAGDDESYLVQECFKVVGTASIMDAIRWQEANANGRKSATLLPVPAKTDSGTPHDGGGSPVRPLKGSGRGIGVVTRDLVANATAGTGWPNKDKKNNRLRIN